MGWVSDRTLSNSYSSTIGNFTLRTCCQCSKMGTDHLFLYLVDFGTALSMQSSSSIVSGSKTFLRSWQKQYVNYFKCSDSSVHQALQMSCWCNWTSEISRASAFIRASHRENLEKLLVPWDLFCRTCVAKDFTRGRTSGSSSVGSEASLPIVSFTDEPWW